MSGGEFEFHRCRWRPKPRPKSILIPGPLTPDGGYTSLTDLIIASPSSAVNSPSATAVEIRIRNSLVKQAAYAYLQPMPSSMESPLARRRRSLSPLCWCFASIGSCFGFLGRFLRRIRIREAIRNG